MSRDQRQDAVAAAVRRFAAADPGRSVAVVSLRGGSVAVAARADVPRPAGSLLKVPLVAAAHRLAVTGALDLDETVARRDLGDTAFGTVLAAFGDDHRFSLRELCALSLVASDNLAAQHLLGRVGHAAVDAVAREIAGPATRLVVGFDDPHLGTDGLVNTTTAREALRMVRIVTTDPQWAPVARAMAAGIRNPRLPLRLRAVRVVGKSGTLWGAVADVGVLLGLDNDLGVAVLCADQADREATGLEIGDLALAVWRALGDPHGSERRP